MTSFALVALYQYSENYGAHDWDGEGECPQYWKCKGGSEVLVADNMSIADVMVGSEALQAMVEAASPESNNYASYGLVDYELIELNDELKAKVIQGAKDQESTGAISAISVSYTKAAAGIPEVIIERYLKEAANEGVVIKPNRYARYYDLVEVA